MKLHAAAVRCFFFFFSLLVLCASCVGHDWAKVVSHNVTVTLLCHDPVLHPFHLLNASSTASSLPVELSNFTWYLPSGRQVDPRSLPAGIGLHAMHTQLTVQASEANQGVYHCAAYFNDTEWFFVRRGVNPTGPKVTGRWQLYRENVIRGIASAGGFLAACLLIAVVFFCRWEVTVGAPAAAQTEMSARLDFTSL